MVYNIYIYIRVINLSQPHIGMLILLAIIDKNASNKSILSFIKKKFPNCHQFLDLYFENFRK